MTDLEKLGQWCLAKVEEPDISTDERRLWWQIIGEIDTYLAPAEVTFGDIDKLAFDLLDD